MQRDESTAVVVAEFARNDREIVRVMLDQFRGHDMISVRNFYHAAGGEWRPDKGGIAMTVRHLPALAKAINDALTAAAEAGLLPASPGEKQ